ncbi:MAG: hypothetical protein U9N53_04340 [Bacteroidota bacterium]|nr:hypothetical protein [Bacteroidota bacterium]
MKLRQIIILSLLFSSSVTFSQTKSLADFKISEIYSKEEAKENVFENLDINIKTVSLNDIDSESTDFNDFEWLKSISKKNKVVLLGETHYSKNIANLKNRIILALNEFDYFPLVIIEQPYSLTPFLNHYLQLRPEKEANTFFRDELNKMISTKEDSIFIEHIKHWNVQNPKKRIQVGCIDLEWSWVGMCEKILKPYFYKLKNADKSEIDKLIELGKKQSNKFFNEIQPFLIEAKKQNLKGTYSFIDYRYIRNVIDNFSATNNALRYSFDYYRQRALINKIENDNYFGDYFKNQKVIMYGGGDHMKSRFYYPNGGNFLSEGSYLNFDYNFTKNKVYSIMLSGLSFSLGEMKEVNIKDCISPGMQYKSILKRMQNAYKAKVLQSDKNYFLFGSRTDFEKFIISKSYEYQTRGIIILEKEWSKITDYSKELNDEKRETIESKNEERIAFDMYIYIPYSPISIARKTFGNK